MPGLEERQRVAAYGLARRANEVLLVRASPSTGVPGKWWLPGGGLRFAESPGKCLVREFMEETGLRVDVGGVVDVVSDVGQGHGHERETHARQPPTPGLPGR